MREQRRSGHRGRRRAAVVTGVLLLAACGQLEPEGTAVVTVEEEPDTTEEPAEEPEPGDEDATEQDADDPDADSGAQDPAEPEDGEEAVDREALALGACDLADTPGAEQLEVDTYERLTLEVNFELELLVSDMAADLDELLSGVSDGPTLEAQLVEHREDYAETVEPLREVVPPEGAEEWHERATGSFDDVCTAIEDGLAGSADGDDERFEAFEAALTAYPGLLNGLHANAACGPFESC